MVRRREEFPSSGELVIGTVKEINPNSIFVQLDEYGKEGMVHISEVASKWVRDIRNWASEGEKVVCKVKDVRENKAQIDLSLKDVSDREKNKRMQQWKRDQRSDDFLETLAEKEDKTKEGIYEEVGYDLQENFKDMLEPFELGVRKGTEELERRGVDKEWASLIEEVGEEKIKVKEREVKGRLSIRSWESDGVETIKSALSEVTENYGVKFNYISAPEYEMVKVSKDPKEGEEVLRKSVGELRNILQDRDVEISSSFD